MPSIYVPADLWQQIVALAARERLGAAQLALEALRALVDQAPIAEPSAPPPAAAPELEPVWNGTIGKNGKPLSGYEGSSSLRGVK